MIDVNLGDVVEVLDPLFTPTMFQLRRSVLFAVLPSVQYRGIFVGCGRCSHGGAHNLQQLSKSLGIKNHVLRNDHHLRHLARRNNTRTCLLFFQLPRANSHRRRCRVKQHETMRLQLPWLFSFFFSSRSLVFLSFMSYLCPRGRP